MYKFRVWDKRTKKMYEPLMINIETNKVYINKEWVKIGEDAVLMLFTGLFDRNGTPIFQHDVITDGKLKLVVKWTGGGFVGIDVDKQNFPMSLATREMKEWCKQSFILYSIDEKGE